MRDIIEFINKYEIPIVKIDENKQYWLIRTNGGTYFNDFLFNDYIGINWNEFNDSEDFLPINKDATTEEISNIYKKNKQPGHTFSHIRRFFYELKIGDIVMIPSEDSKIIAFGEITSDVFISEISQTEIDEGSCPYQKRRNVNWIKMVNRTMLDPYLYKMMNSHLTISNANDYADAIDRTMYSYYYKKDKAHFVLNVKQEDNIPLVDLLDALKAPLELVDYIQDPISGEGYSKKDLDAKLRVQSIGVIEFVSSGAAFGLSVILGLLIVGLIGGTVKFNFTEEKKEGELSSDGLLEKIIKLKEIKHKHKMESLRETERNLIKAKDNLKIETPKELDNFTVKKDVQE